MTDITETAFDYYGDEKTAYFSTSEKKWVKRILELKEKFPNDVTIKQTPEENDGCLCAVLPKGWFKIAPPKKINLSEEYRAKRSARALAAREARAKKRGA